MEELNKPGQLGLKTPLVDDEGYPIADWDKIVSAREKRNQISGIVPLSFDYACMLCYVALVRLPAYCHG